MRRQQRTRSGLLVAKINEIPAKQHFRWIASLNKPASPIALAGTIYAPCRRRQRRPSLEEEDAGIFASPDASETSSVPEGDTIFRAARTLDRALAGHTVTPVRIRPPEALPSRLRSREFAAAPSNGSSRKGSGSSCISRAELILLTRACS